MAKRPSIVTDGFLTGPRTNPHSTTAPSVVAFRLKQAAKRRLQQELSRETAITEDVILAAYVAPSFQTLEPETLAYRVADKIVRTFRDVKPTDKGLSARIAQATTRAINELGLTGNIGPSRTGVVQYGKRMAHESLTWAHTQILNATADADADKELAEV